MEHNNKTNGWWEKARQLTSKYLIDINSSISLMDIKFTLHALQMHHVDLMEQFHHSLLRKITNDFASTKLIIGCHIYKCSNMQTSHEKCIHTQSKPSSA